jgi:hypothetical protein
MAANQTKAEVDPPAPGFQTFLTTLSAGRDQLDLIYMAAFHFEFLLLLAKFDDIYCVQFENCT